MKQELKYNKILETLECDLFQAVSFLPKTLCDVKRVEIARAVRLCKSSVELFYFTVTRTKVGGISRGANSGGRGQLHQVWGNSDVRKD